MRKTYHVLLVVGLLLAGAPPTGAAEQRLKVVATLSTFGDLVRAIGGDQVTVSVIASPRFNPHFIEPKPTDVLRVKQADLLVHAGLDLEAWRGPLLDAAGNRDIMPQGPRELDLSVGIALLEVPDHLVSRAEGDIHLFGNPHYWTDPENAKIMAKAISEKLSAVMPEHAAEFHQRLQAFLARLEAKIADWHARLAPFKDREIIGYHNEWPYLMRFAGLRMTQYLEPKPGIPPTPQQVEFIQQYIKAHGVRGIVQATYFPTRAAASLAKRTGAGVVFLCQNVGEMPACLDYIAMVDYNVAQLVEGLRHE